MNGDLRSLRASDCAGCRSRPPSGDAADRRHVNRRGTIFVVDRDDGARQAAARILRGAGFKAASRCSGDRLLDSALPPWSCILLDLGAPSADGLALVPRLRARHPDIPIVAMSAQPSVATAVEVLKRGACDFVEKPVTRGRLLEAVNGALERRREAPARDFNQRDRARTLLAQLSPRELEVLRSLVTGATNRAMAEAMGLSARTVEMHRANMMAKLDVARLADALRLAYEAGLTPDRRHG